MAEEKKITVDELIKKVETARKTKKDYPFEKHIVRNYMPYSEKEGLVKSIVRTTSYKKVEDTELYERNTLSMLFVLTMKLIESYTHVSLNINDIVSDYDKLMESGIMDKLMDSIPESEITIIKGMLDMVRDDLEENTRSLVSFLETKTKAMEMAMGRFEKILSKPEIKDKINGLL